MTKIKILITVILLSLISCSKDDDNSTDDIPQAENCKISTITYGFYSGNIIYTAIYNGENLIELTSNGDKAIFTYNSNNQLISREKFETGNTVPATKQEFSYNSNGQVIEQRNWDTYLNNLIYVGKKNFEYNGNNLAEIIAYNEDDTTISGKFIYEWTGDNPTKLSIYDGNDVLECENTISYDLTKENRFNSTFTYFAFQDIYDEDFQLYLFLGKNVVTSTTNSCTGNTDNYNITLQSNGLIDNVKLNGDLLWEFEYHCE